MEKGKDDLFEGLVKRREEWVSLSLNWFDDWREQRLLTVSSKNLSLEKFCSNGLILTLAGSETLATSLCGMTYLLLDNPSKMETLTREVRAAFGSADDITIKAVSKLPYLTAVINESLRMYPPVVADLIRVVPPEGKQIAGHYVAGGVSVLL
jgi:cytochrome P450